MGGHRYLFMTAWKGATLAGTSYRFPTGGSHSLPAQVRELMEEWNAACPGLQWKTSDVSNHHCGRLPLREGHEAGRPTALLDRSLIIDHRKSGLARLLSVVGTKFTTARQVAEKTVDVVFESLGRTPERCMTSEVPLVADGAVPPDLVAGARASDSR